MMANSPVLKLQQLACSEESSILSVMFQAKLIASKLELDEFSTWIENEISGYPEKLKVPDYRKIAAPMKCQLNNGVIQDFDFDRAFSGGARSEDERKILSKLKLLYLTDSLSEVKRLSEKDDYINFSIPVGIKELLRSSSNGRLDGQQFEIFWVCPSVKMLQIISSARMRILNWSLELEKIGILGDGIVFSQDDKITAPLTINNTNIFNESVNNTGVIGAGSSGEISQRNSFKFQDFEELSRNLKELGVKLNDIQQLKKIISDSQPPEKLGNFDPKIGSWIGRVIGLAYSGKLKISGADASALIVMAISSYYGV
ncbi:hypothetical protein PIG65_11540 [Enterobacter sp. FR 78]|uniref:AbiTii domain-containing protein n=1 Tax=Enterobacter sp. FR 78 TaxID=3021714 RepID=UPI0023A9D8FF|nr:hypothetical protein [Enterobacter sp. FR 78]MDD9579157.1 hypothetical protein [Enterobacter sp. FR 78]